MSPSRWDGKIGKIPKISDKRKGKRFSPRLTGGEPEFHECRQPDEEYQRSDNGALRSPGAAELYTPETVGQYKSQWARYQRALTLNPASITQQGKKVLYKFESCDSITGFWEVEVSSGATYLNITKPVLQILCPRPTVLDMIESDGETFTWTQTRGKRTAELNGIFLKASQESPPFGFNPELDILSFCLDGNGCSDTSVEPIVLNVQPEGQPELFDSIIIYTTPTSSYYGNSFGLSIAAPDVAPCRKVPSIILPPSAPLPQYLSRAYIYPTPNNTLTLSWLEPTCDTEYLLGTIWQENTTGEYVDLQYFPKNSILSFSAKLNTHYRVLSVFNVRGKLSAIDSSRFYFTQNTNCLVLADDNLNGLSFTNFSRKQTLPLARISLNILDVYSGISFGFTSRTTTLPLDKKILEYNDSLNGISFNSFSKITKTDLGGVIIS